jgi:hypothetical protein
MLCFNILTLMPQNKILLITDTPSSVLGKSIKSEYNKLVKLISLVPKKKRYDEDIKGTGGWISINDLIAYQIGWGNLLINWYEMGISGKNPEMPGDGFNKWDYKNLALHFYDKYYYKSNNKYDKIFFETVTTIIEIADEADNNNQLNIPGFWDWTVLKSGKVWPLSKWIIINTVAPYKKASLYVKSFLRNIEKL